MRHSVFLHGRMEMELKFARVLLTSQNDVSLKAAFSCTSAPRLQTQLVNSILNHRSASNLFIQTCYGATHKTKRSFFAYGPYAIWSPCRTTGAKSKGLLVAIWISVPYIFRFPSKFIGWSDVKVISGHTTISMLWGNTTHCVKLSGEDIMSRYSNKIWISWFKKMSALSPSY